jgi:RNA-directed DNA polymerase
VRKYDDKLLIKPARKSVKALLQKVSAIIKEEKAATQAKVIVRLNPILRGWGMYT